jgi:hypothetical protein
MYANQHHVKICTKTKNILAPTQAKYFFYSHSLFSRIGVQLKPIHINNTSIYCERQYSGPGRIY